MSEMQVRPPGLRLLDPRPFVLEMRRTFMVAAQETKHGNYVRANGIDIHYVEAGDGPPLLLLNNGMVSTNPVWAALPMTYAAFIDTFASRFRVVVPDFRAAGRTVHHGGPISYDLLADDFAAMVGALDLGRPSVCGFSEGGSIATIMGVRHPDAVGPIVNLDGHDVFNPDRRAPNYALCRQMLGGHPDASKPDAAAAQQNEMLRPMFELMKADHDAAQGSGHWRTVYELTFERVTEPSGYTVDDLGAIRAPTLLLCGDRSPFCSIEEGATAYRSLVGGEFGVLPNTGHEINRTAVAATIEFFERHLA
jgi:pimeloyl-ACP methyl ester carboxylesterase